MVTSTQLGLPVRDLLQKLPEHVDTGHNSQRQTIYGSSSFKGLLFAAPKVWSQGNEVSSSSRNSSRRTHKVALAPAPWARTPGFLIYGLLHI